MSRERLSQFSRFGKPVAAFGAATALLVVVCAFAPLPLQIGYLGVLVSAVVALLMLKAPGHLAGGPSVLEDPLLLAKDANVFELYRSVTHSLKGISLSKDPIYRSLALQRVTELADELHNIAEGRFVFVGTETWRMTYAQLLRSPGLHLYRSIAYVKTATYWQDQPGRHSMQATVQMIRKGTLSVERIAIIPEHLWPAGDWFPVQPVHDWITRQHENGISIALVRQSVLANDQDLVIDLGIYGNRAVGVQELDEQGRTVRFTLSFEFAEVLAAEQRWERLSVYAAPYRDLLKSTTD